MIRCSAYKLAFHAFCVAAVCIPVAASTFKTLITFNGSNGTNPVDTPLVQGIDGRLYGTTLGGGTNNAGTVLKISPAGVLTTLYSFCALPNCADGTLPYGGLVLASDGNFYGTTSQGGIAKGVSGTIFRITPAGNLTTLHSFDASDGSFPNAPLIEGIDGALYGLTANGGPANAGTFFKITLDGTLTTLYDFPGGGDLNGPLLQGSDGNFYGTSEIGGANGYGMIFQFTPTGGFSIVHSFDSTDGSGPACGLLQSSDGDLYGTTYAGGSNNTCPNGCGTVFKISLAGSFTTLYNFDSTHGSNPIATLIQGTDGNYYGTTYGGGTSGWGTVFRITRLGKITTLHSFKGTDGAQPYGPVSQHTGGKFYGTSTNGTGGAAEGTLFSFSRGSKPFVSFIQSRGRVGQTIGILGQGLATAAGVSFAGVDAAFNIQSDTYLTVTVPSGAKSGYVIVKTSTASLKSNVKFQVLP